MNVSTVGSSPALMAVQAARQNYQVKAANREARESAASEATESRAQQVAEGELGRSVNTYA